VAPPLEPGAVPMYVKGYNWGMWKSKFLSNEKHQHTTHHLFHEWHCVLISKKAVRTFQVFPSLDGLDWMEEM
jgi:hypothetical protein